MDTRLNVLVVSYRVDRPLAACLDSVSESLPDAAVAVWDNRSDRSEAIHELAVERPEIDWHFADDNLGFAKAVNALALTAGPGDLLLLNPDARLIGDLSATRAVLTEPGVAAAAPRVRDGDRRTWDNAHREPGLLRQIGGYAGYGVRCPWLSDLYAEPPTGPVGYLTGACLLVKRQAWDSVGPFDERYFLYSEEADWAARARAAGWTLRLADELGAEHSAGGTVADDPARTVLSRRYLARSQVRYLQDHHGSVTAGTYVAAQSVLSRAQGSKRRAAKVRNRPHIVISSNTLGFGGAERQRVQLANGLADRGYGVTMALLQAGGPLEAELSKGIEVVRTPWHRPAPDIAGAALLITGTTNTEAAYGRLWRAATLGHGRRRWVVAAHTPPRPDGPTYTRPLATMIRASDGVIALANSHWEQLTAAQRLHSRPPFVVPNGIALPSEESERVPPTPGDGLRLAFVGRLVEHKGAQVAVEALVALADRPWSLDIYGDGPHRDAVEDAIPAGLADRIRIRGWVADPRSLLLSADVLLLPSRLEALPLVLLEAMSSGCAVMANAAGAVPELLADAAGLLVDGTSVDAWRDALRELLDHPERVSALAQRGRARVAERYRIDRMLQGYEDVIATVIGR